MKNASERPREGRNPQTVKQKTWQPHGEESFSLRSVCVDLLHSHGFKSSPETNLITTQKKLIVACPNQSVLVPTGFMTNQGIPFSDLHESGDRKLKKQRKKQLAEPLTGNSEDSWSV